MKIDKLKREMISLIENSGQSPKASVIDILRIFQKVANECEMNKEDNPMFWSEIEWVLEDTIEKVWAVQSEEA